MCSTCGCKDAESFQAPIRPDDELCVSCGKDEVAIKSNLCEECQKGMGIKKINARRLAELGWTAESLEAETSIAQEYSETIDDIEDLEEQVKKTVAPKRKPTKYLREAKGSVMDSWKQMRKDGFRKEMYDQYIKDAEEFGAESCTCNDMFGSLCPQCNYDSDREGGVCPKGCTVDLAGSVRPQEMEIYTECKIHGQKLGAEEFGADGYGEMVYVKRPHHVAYVRKEVAERPMDKGFEYPNMHTDQNKQGKIWDDRSGFRKMDSKERGLFEEIGGKISDFDVVGTTQDVVGKTGFNIPTGVASIAVVFMAYMTGKKYGN